MSNKPSGMACLAFVIVMIVLGFLSRVVELLYDRVRALEHALTDIINERCLE